MPCEIIRKREAARRRRLLRPKPPRRSRAGRRRRRLSAGRRRPTNRRPLPAGPPSRPAAAAAAPPPLHTSLHQTGAKLARRPAAGVAGSDRFTWLGAAGGAGVAADGEAAARGEAEHLVPGDVEGAEELRVGEQPAQAMHLVDGAVVQRGAARVRRAPP